MIFVRLADFIQRNAKKVLLVWLAVLLLSVYPALHTSDLMEYNLYNMNDTSSESGIGEELMHSKFYDGIQAEDTAIVVLSYDSSDDAVVTQIYQLYLKPAFEAYPKIAMMQDSHSDGLYTVYLIYKNEYSTQRDTPNLRAIVSDCISSAASDGYRAPSLETYVTGTPAMNYDTMANSNADLAKIDPIAVLMILILVGLFFRSIVTSAAPPVVVGASFAITMGILFGICSMMNVYFITQILLIVSMLGACCDYCIFILARYREERRRGLPHEEACRQAIIWAGESVATSGVAVVIGFGSMMVCSYEMVSTMGLCVAIGILVGLLAALTLMSSILFLAGDRLYWPTGPVGDALDKGYFVRFKKLGERYFRSSAEFSIKHAKAILVATLLFTVPMVAVYANTETSYDGVNSMLAGESKDALSVMSKNMYEGELLPFRILLETEEPLAVIDYSPLLGGEVGILTWGSGYESVLDAIDSLTASILSCDDNVGRVDSLYTWEQMVEASGATTIEGVVNYVGDHSDTYGFTTTAILQMIYGNEQARTLLNLLGPNDDLVRGIFDWGILYMSGKVGVDPVTNNDGSTSYEVRYIDINVATKAGAMDNVSIDTLETIRTMLGEYIPASTLFAGYWVTGSAVSGYDLCSKVSADFSIIEPLAVILITLLLFFVIKSYLTPVRSVLTILMSVIWTLAITNLLFDNLADEPILWLVPIILFVVCLGLGMDYDILLTTRIREYHVSKGMSNDEAISEAIQHSGSVITICGIIMGLTFGTLCLSMTPALRQIGFALMFAILMDALVIRTYIVPAAMHLMGEYNWKGPRFFNKNRQ